MKKMTKATVALVTVGGALLMAAPVALAGTNGLYIIGAQYSGSLTGASSSQWQNGTDTSGTTLDQNSSVSAGQLSATSYNSGSSNSGSWSSTQVGTSRDGGSTVGASSTTGSSGGSSSLYALGYNTSGSSVTQNQSQVIAGNDGAEGAKQGQTAVSLTANSGNICYNNFFEGGQVTLNGAELATNNQTQRGNEATNTVMNSTASLQTNNTTANLLESGSSITGGYSTSTNMAGNSFTKTSGGTNLSTTSTTIYGLHNPTASVSQDQNQIIGYDGQGGVQKQTGNAVVLPGTATLWGVAMGPN